MQDIDGKLTDNLSSFGIAADSPIATALKSNTKGTPETPDHSDGEQKHASSVADLRSQLFHMEAAGFKEGDFCKNKRSGDVYQIVATTEAGMEISKWTDGTRSETSEWVDACEVLSKFAVERRVQEILNVTATMLPTSQMTDEASKSVALLGLHNKANKYTKTNHEALEILCTPTVVKSKRKFSAMEMKIVELSLQVRRARRRHGPSDVSPTAHGAVARIV